MTQQKPGSVGRFEPFLQRQQTLLDLIDRAGQAATELDLATICAQLFGVKDRVKSDVFRVVVLGHFNAGKSTLLNALLGQEVLPMHADPTTAIINEVKWGDAPSVVLHHLDPSKPPCEIPLRQLESYVAIDPSNPTAVSPYERAEIFWPLTLLRNRVELVDSPGLNEDRMRDDITTSYLEYADAVILVTFNHGRLSLTERAFLTAHVTSVHRDSTFFVSNRMNNIRKAEERERVVRGLRLLLSEEPFLARPDRLFFTDALDALEARVGGDAEPTGAGVAEFQQVLERFLAEERGRVKIIVPARQLQRGLSEISRSAREQEQLLALKLEDLRKRTEDTREELDVMRRERDDILIVMKLHADRLETEVQIDAREYLDELTGRIRGWANRDDLGRDHQSGSVTAEAVAEEVASRLQKDLDRWRETALRNLFERRAGEAEREVGARVRALAQHADGIRARLTGLDSAEDDEELSDSEGLLSGEPPLSLATSWGNEVGSARAINTLAGALAPGLAAAALRLGPLGIIGAALVAVAQRAVTVWGEQERRRQVGEAIEGELRRNAPEEARRIAVSVRVRLDRRREAVEQHLTAVIQTIEEQMEAVLADKERGETEGHERKKRLELIAATIERIGHDLTDLLVQATV